jgi:hypothetical protein
LVTAQQARVSERPGADACLYTPDVLEGSHEIIERLLAEWEGLCASDCQTAHEFLPTLFRELDIHRHIETAAVYHQLLTRMGSLAVEPHVNELVQANTAIDLLVGQVRALDPADDRYLPTVHVLFSVVRRHIASNRSLPTQRP